MADQASQGFFSPYLRSRRLAIARPFLSGRVLDVGCGAGMLADDITPERYWGVDPDEMSLAAARLRHGRHRFEAQMPPPAERGGFRTVVALAVIEHVLDPCDFLRQLVDYLARDGNAMIVLTTPHPLYGGLHRAGAGIGLFSREAHDEHQTLLDHRQLSQLGMACGLELLRYRRFLCGANQLVVFRRKSL